MPVYYFHQPYSKASRDKLLELQQRSANVILVIRKNPSHDMGHWISFLPTILLTDDKGKELARMEHTEHMTKQNVDWLHSEHDKWKQSGGKKQFPNPPWRI